MCFCLWRSILRVFQSTCPCLSVYVPMCCVHTCICISVYPWVHVSPGVCFSVCLCPYPCLSDFGSMSVHVCFDPVHVSLCDCVLCMPKCLYTRLPILCSCLFMTVSLCWREEFCVCGFACIYLLHLCLFACLCLLACLPLSLPPACFCLSWLVPACLPVSLSASAVFVSISGVSKLRPMS